MGAVSLRARRSSTAAVATACSWGSVIPSKGVDVECCSVVGCVATLEHGQINHRQSKPSDYEPEDPVQVINGEIHGYRGFNPLSNHQGSVSAVI